MLVTCTVCDTYFCNDVPLDPYRLYEKCQYALSFSNDLCMQLECVLLAIEEALRTLDNTPYEEDMESVRQLCVCAKD